MVLFRRRFESKLPGHKSHPVYPIATPRCAVLPRIICTLRMFCCFCLLISFGIYSLLLIPVATLNDAGKYITRIHWELWLKSDRNQYELTCRISVKSFPLMDEKIILKRGQRQLCGPLFHFSDVIMGAMAHQITSLTIVYSTVYSGTKKQCVLRTTLAAYRSPGSAFPTFHSEIGQSSPLNLKANEVSKYNLIT